MANMSYCRFRNTLQDLRDCYYNMKDEVSLEEFRSRKQVIELCKDIVDEYGDEDYSLFEKEDEE